MNKIKIKPHIKINGYEFQREIGRGQFSVVWEATHLSSNCRVAIKCISHNESIEKTENAVFKEIYFNQKIFHPYVCQYFDFFEAESTFFLVFEICVENLVTFSNKRGFLDEKTTHTIFCELVYAVESLHNDYHIIHRDLKVENVLIDSNKNIRLSDFGLSTSIQSSYPRSFTKLLNQQVGSIYYMSPEMAKNEEYDKSIDIWSLGIILYSITNGRLPFDGDSVDSIQQKILFTQPQFQSHFNSTFSPSLKTLIIRMLDKNRKSRITIDEIKNNSWFVEKKYSKIEEFQKISFDLSQLQIDRLAIEKQIKTEADLVIDSINNQLNELNRIKKNEFMMNLNSHKNESNDEKNQNVNSNQNENQIINSNHNQNIKDNINVISNDNNVDVEIKANKVDYEKYGVILRSSDFVTYLINLRQKIKEQMKILEKDVITSKSFIAQSPHCVKRQMSQPSKPKAPLSQTMKPNVKKPIVPTKKQVQLNKSKKQPLSLTMKASYENRKKKS